jgi:outer membrane receptor protein involved in Fe transport
MGDAMRLAVAAVFLSFALASAKAQSPETNEVDEIVVAAQAQRELSFDAAVATASRSDAPLFNLPASLGRIDQNEMSTAPENGASRHPKIPSAHALNMAICVPAANDRAGLGSLQF